MCRGAIRLVLEDFLGQEVERLIGAKRYERSSKRRGMRNGSYLRGLLDVPGAPSSFTSRWRGRMRLKTSDDPRTQRLRDKHG